MLSRIDLRQSYEDLAAVLPRPRRPRDGPVAAVREIMAEVQAVGDAAIRAYTEKFDGVCLGPLAVDPAEMMAATQRVDPVVLRALQHAADSIETYHREQRPSDIRVDRPGVSIRGLHRAVDRAGCYVPGGRAVYPSTVLMTALPAKVAGVGEVVVCVPPGPDGSVPDVVLAAAHVAGVDEILSIGGAQAIAAIAYGTQTIRAVDVIVGPGNVYVSLAKQEVAGLVGVPSAFAGPSEIVVIADGSAPASFAAVDLIVQAEHGPDGLAWLVTWDDVVAEQILVEISRLVTDAPRADDISATLVSAGRVVVCRDAEQAIEVANFIAPEHLELQTQNPEALVPLVKHAGAIFCGPFAPASLGDYAAGPSHVLPTSGTARFASALTVRDFMKDIHVVSVDKYGFAGMADTVEVLAQAEGLDAHAASIRIRRMASNE